MAPVATILQRVPAQHLVHLYRIAPFEGADDMLAQVAHARGKLLKGGVPDVRTAARLVLQDWNDGRIAFYTRPPPRAGAEAQSAQLVAQFAADFDADAVYGAEAGALAAAAPADATVTFAEVASMGPQHVRLLVNAERMALVSKTAELYTLSWWDCEVCHLLYARAGACFSAATMPGCITCRHDSSCAVVHSGAGQCQH